MRRIGITGLPGAGKTTVAKMFEELGAAVFDADGEVRALYAPGGEAARTLLARYPDLGDGQGGIDRHRLRARLRENPALLEEIEKLVHPLVAKRREAFLRLAEEQGAPVAVLEIPLLYETGAEKELDAVIWVERGGQKPIIIGRQGRVLKKIGIQARRDMERLFGRRVMLHTWVKVKERWTEDERALKQLGFDA